MKATITLEDGKLPLVEFEKNGTKRTIHTNLRDILGIIESSYTTDEDSDKKNFIKPICISPALPIGTIKYSLNDKGEHVIFMQFNEFSSSFYYHETEFKDVPFPKLIFCFRIKDNSVIGRSVMVYKDRFVRDETKLYRFPYANVFEDGGLCYYEDREIKDFVQLQTFPYRWATVKMNDHLYWPSNTSKEIPLRQLLEESQGKPFDYDILKPTGHTFHSWSVRFTGKEEDIAAQ